MSIKDTLAVQSMVIVTQQVGTITNARPTSNPPLPTDTSGYDILGADIGVTWDSGDSRILVGYGDIVGSSALYPIPLTLVNGTLVYQGNSYTPTSISRTLNALQATTPATGFSGGVLTFGVGGGVSGFDSSGYVSINTGTGPGGLAIFSYTSKDTFTGTLGGVTYVAGGGNVGPGQTVYQGDPRTGARGSVLAVSTDTDIRNGYTIDSFYTNPSPTTLQAGVAWEPWPFPSGDRYGAGRVLSQKKDVYPRLGGLTVGSFIDFTDISRVGGYLVFTTSAAHGLEANRPLPHGTTFAIGGYTGAILGLDSTEQTVYDVPSTTTFRVVWFGGGTGGAITPGTCFAFWPYNQWINNPTVAPREGNVVWGATSVTKAGALNNKRQVAFLRSTFRLAAITSCDLWYSDDGGATWTLGSSPTSSGTNGSSATAVNGYNGSQTISCSTASTFTASGQIAIQTAFGYALIAYTSKTASTFVGCTFISGGYDVTSGTYGNTVAGGVISQGYSGATWVNASTFDSPINGITPYRDAADIEATGFTYVYSICTPGNILARVKEADILTKASWEYWTGSTWSGSIPSSATAKLWNDSPSNAVSLSYNTHFGVWMAAYTTGFSTFIRFATSLTGTWSAAHYVCGYGDFGVGQYFIYGSWIHPYSGASPQANDVVYIGISMFGSYETYLLKVSLVDAGTVDLMVRKVLNTLQFEPTGKIANHDSWYVDNHTWVYASATSFTVAADVTRYIKPKTKISYNDGAVDYGLVSTAVFSAGTTTVTLVANNDYSIANATLTAPRYSHVELPPGWPGEFAITTTVTGITAGNGTVNWSTYSYSGGRVRFRYKFTLGSTSSVAGPVVLSVPLAIDSSYATNTDQFPCMVMCRTSVNVMGAILWVSSTTIGVRVHQVSGANVVASAITSTVPATWATGSILEVEVFYLPA